MRQELEVPGGRKYSRRIYKHLVTFVLTMPLVQDVI